MTDEEDDTSELAEAKRLLIASDLCFEQDDDPDDPMPPFMLNLNDTFGWACADGEIIPEEQLVEVARLVRRYGYCGALYWASKVRGWERTAFQDNNRFIDFVRHEEELRERVPSSSKRGCERLVYTLGEQPKEAK
jgi:hypothetical protein